jgi:hypothetical protein
MTGQQDFDIQRRVLDQFLAEPRWSHAGLKVQLHDVDPAAVDGALVGLLLEGLIARDGAQTWLLAPAVRHLAALGLLDPEPGSPERANGLDDDRSAIDRVLARQALQDYARRREADRDPAKLVAELPALVDRGIAAGLDLVTISALAEGRKA